MSGHQAGEVAIVGGGIGGLALALSLHRVGIASRVYEAVAEMREVGVGITLLPHAMRELAALGLAEKAEAAGIENLESIFFNRFGQAIFREPRGRHAGYPLPEVGLPRAQLHRLLLDAFIDRVGPSRLHLGRRCLGVAQDSEGVTLRFADGGTATAAVAVACDGINSPVRAQFYPQEKLAFGGINTWRGVTVHKPILTGRSYLRIGSINTGKMVIYPIADNVDGQGNQLVNWVAEIRRDGSSMNDWNRAGKAEDFVGLFADWRYDWLDVPALIRGAERIFEYPMVDRDPVPRWTFGRVTLLGDAAHPMYPRGSNGSAQALVDARVLAEGLGRTHDPFEALSAYESARLQATARIIETNRTVPPDFINIRVEELTGDKPFVHIDDVISQQELQRLSDEYKQVAGFSLQQVRA